MNHQYKFIATFSLALLLVLGFAPTSNAAIPLDGVREFGFVDGKGRGSIWCRQIIPKNLVGKVLSPFVNTIIGSRREIGVMAQRAGNEPQRIFTTTGWVSDAATGVIAKHYNDKGVMKQLGQNSAWYHFPEGSGHPVSFYIANPGRHVFMVSGSVYRQSGRIAFQQNGDPTVDTRCQVTRDDDKLNQTDAAMARLIIYLLRAYTRTGPSAVP